MAHKAILSALLAMLLVAAGTQSATATKLTLKNNCPYPIWPGTLQEMNSSSLSPAGFELSQGATKTLDAPAKYDGAVWARTHCAKDSHGKFKCVTGDCRTGVAECKGENAFPDHGTTMVVLNLHHGGNDSYRVDLGNGFNVPVSVVPSGGSRAHCRSIACPVDLNAHCPKELAVVVDGRIVACKSACSASNAPDCCTGMYFVENDCRPTQYDRYFMEKCPEADTGPFVDKSKVAECKEAESYAITFCP